MQYLRGSPGGQKHAHGEFEGKKSRITISKIPWSEQYRNLVIICTICPMVATILFVTAASMDNWERVSFNWSKIMQQRKLGEKNIETLSHKLISKNGTITTVMDNASQLVIPKDTFGMHFKARVNVSSHVPNDLKNIDHDWCLFNLKGGIWQICDDFDSRTELPKTIPCSSVIVSSWNYQMTRKNLSSGWCSNYLWLTQDIFTTNSSVFYLKMQNNIASCSVVVIICVISSVVIGSFAIATMTVPASMVCSTMYLVAGIFVVFINTIFHLKVLKVEKTWGWCYPHELLPIILDPSPLDIQVVKGPPIIISWISSLFYFLAFFLWTSLTRNMNFECSKAYL